MNASYRLNTCKSRGSIIEACFGRLYKPVPWIYHRLPSEEDLYALFAVCHARLVGRDLSSALIPKAPARWSHGRRYAVSEARKKGVCVAPSDDFSAFWPLLTRNLQTRYGVSPVHTLEEMQRLHARFPERIRLLHRSIIWHMVSSSSWRPRSTIRTRRILPPRRRAIISCVPSTTPMVCLWL